MSPTSSPLRAWAPELFRFGGRPTNLEYWEDIHRRLPENVQVRATSHAWHMKRELEEAIEDTVSEGIHPSTEDTRSPWIQPSGLTRNWAYNNDSSMDSGRAVWYPFIEPQVLGLFINGQYLRSVGGSDQIELVPIEFGRSDFSRQSPVGQDVEEAFRLFNDRLEAEEHRPSHHLDVSDIDDKRVPPREAVQDLPFKCDSRKRQISQASTTGRPVTRGLIKQQLEGIDEAKRAQRRVTRAATRSKEAADEKKRQQRGVKAKNTGSTAKQRKRKQYLNTADNTVSRDIAKASLNWAKLRSGEVAIAFVLLRSISELGK